MINLGISCRESLKEPFRGRYEELNVILGNDYDTLGKSTSQVLFIFYG